MIGEREIHKQKGKIKVRRKMQREYIIIGRRAQKDKQNEICKSQKTYLEKERQRNRERGREKE